MSSSPKTIREHLSHVLILSALTLFTEGCGTLLGSAAPVDKKSDSYAIGDLSKEGTGWERLAPEKEGLPSTAVSDFAYRSRTGASVIAISSACRSKVERFGNTPKEDLRLLTNPLFMGSTQVTDREEQDLVVQGALALQTTFTGWISEERITVQAVVLRSGTCIYHLVYAARPWAYAEDKKTFARFVSSFRLQGT